MHLLAQFDATSYQYQWLFVAVFFLIAPFFALLPLAINWLVAPSKPGDVKGDIYECGLKTKGDTWVQFRNHYYIFAIVFVIFDIEAIFILPWAVAFDKLELFAFVEMVIFILLLAEGLAYAWRKGVLEWR